jgi:chemotaxis protein CheD
MISRKKYFLFAGQFIITTVPAEIITILGSCVSVCLWDKKMHSAGISHFLLPGTDSAEDTGNADRGNSSTRMLIRSMLNRQSQREDLEAKVFGGCNSLYMKGNRYFVGKKNAEMALKILEDERIPVVASHTGGEYGRKIIFNTRTGKVRMRLLRKTGTELNEEIYKGFGV